MNKTLLNILAGALGGALVFIILLNSPRAASLFGQQPQETPRPVSTQTKDGDYESLENFETAVINSVEKANPAVVSIVVTKDVPIIERFFEEEAPLDPFGGGVFGDDLFSQFRLRVPQYRQNGTEKREVGGGSGFLVTADGMIVTNRHVVANDDVEYSVLTNDGTNYDATVIARDPVHDLAVIKIEGSDLPFLEMAETDGLRLGQTVIAIGNALAEFRNTVSVGVVSGLSRSIIAGSGNGQTEQLEEVIQTDAAINPGNSGGPLLNLDGKVVGVNVAVALESENIGFALPGQLVRGVLESVQETGRIVRPFIGVRYVPVTESIMEANNLSVDYGVLVLRGGTVEELAVVPGSPADKAGLREGDIILEVDGVRLEGTNSLAGEIRKRKVGDSIRLKILSQGEEQEVRVTLEELPE